MEKLVFTSKQVLEDGLPILYIVHDNEDDWQFLSGFEKEDSDGRVISIDELSYLDRDLSDLSWLLMGMEARRNSLNDEWTISVFNDSDLG